MSWKQIPYPPTTRAPLRGEERLVLERGRLRVAWDRASGRIVSLRDAASGVEYLLPGSAGITYRLLSREGIWLDGAAQSAESCERTTDDTVVVRCVRPRVSGVEFPVRLTLTYELGEDDFGPHLACRANVEHLGGDLIVERVQFPVVDGLHEFAGDATELILPFIGGERRPEPVSREWSDFEYVYPNEAMSWMLLHDGSRGLSLASEDPDFRWTVLRGRTRREGDPARLELLFETCPYLREGECAETQPFVLHPYSGTWHRPADRYRAWLSTWWRKPESPDWVKEIRALIELFLQMPHADGRVEQFEPDQLLDYARRVHSEMGLDVAHVCGYHEGGFDAFYPLYEPLARIGGEEGLREFLSRANAEPALTSDIYINCRITDTQTEWWGGKGREWACTGKDGTVTTEYYNGQYFTVACPAIPERQQWWLETVRRITRGYGSEGLQVDQPHTTARECWAFERHGHHTPFDHWGPGLLEQFRQIREELVEREPRVWSWGEAASDVFSQWFDFSCCYVRYPEQRVAFGETDPATRDWVHDWRGFGMPEVFRYICPEVPMIQCPRVEAPDVEDLYERLHLLFCYSVMLYWPSLSTGYDLERVPAAFRARLKELWDLRHELRETMIHGLFRDAVGLSASPAELYAKLYVARGGVPEVTVIAIHRGREAEAEARISLDPAALGLDAGLRWSWRECALAPPSAADLRERAGDEGVLAQVTIPPNRLAVVVFRGE